MYVYIKRFHFICKILYFFSFSLLFFFFLQKMMTRFKEKISYITVSKMVLALRRRWVAVRAVMHSPSQLVLCKKRERN